jgi:WD40 repeat protein
MGLVNSDPSISDQESAIVTCSADGTIRLWSLTHEGEEIGRASSTGAFCVIINLARAQWMARLGYTS